MSKTHIRHHNYLMVIDTGATLSVMRKANPDFFKNGERGDKYFVYRGYLMVRKAHGGVSVWAFDSDRAVFIPVNQCGDLIRGKAVIDGEYGRGENGLTLHRTTTTVTITVEVKADTYFEEGKIISAFPTVDAEDLAAHVRQQACRQLLGK